MIKWLIKNSKWVLNNKGQTRMDWINAMQAELRGIAQETYERGRTALETEFEVARGRGERIVGEEIGRRGLFGEGGRPSTPGQALLLDFLEGLEARKMRGLAGLERERGGLLGEAAGVPLRYGDFEEKPTFWGRFLPALAKGTGAFLGGQAGGEAAEEQIENLMRIFGADKKVERTTRESLPLTSFQRWYEQFKGR